MVALHKSTSQLRPATTVFPQRFLQHFFKQRTTSCPLFLRETSHTFLRHVPGVWDGKVEPRTVHCEEVYQSLANPPMVYSAVYQTRLNTIGLEDTVWPYMKSKTNQETYWLAYTVQCVIKSILNQSFCLHSIKWPFPVLCTPYSSVLGVVITPPPKPFPIVL